MVIYYDLFVFENFIFNLFVLYTSFKMLNLKLNLLRLLIASAISSFIASLIFNKFKFCALFIIYYITKYIKWIDFMYA